MSNKVSAKAPDDFDGFFDDWFKAATRKEQAQEKAEDRRLTRKNKNMIAKSDRNQQKRFANIENFVFDASFWDKPCLQVDGSQTGLWVDTNGNPKIKDHKVNDDGLYFVRVDLDKPFDINRMAYLAQKAQAKSSVVVEMRRWANTRGDVLAIESVKGDKFGDGTALVDSLIIFEYEISSNTLKVYQPHYLGDHNPNRRNLVYANVNGKKTSNQSKLTKMFGKVP